MSAAVAHALPPAILALFAPRPPIEFKPPIERRKGLPYTGVSNLVDQFEEPSQTPPPPPAPESKEARRERIRKLRAEQAAEKAAAAAESYDPNADTKIKGDPYKTLFVSRISYETTEAKLKKEFEQFGPIKRIRLVFNTDTGRPRGYAFIEYEQERDMKTAYKQGDGRKIDGRRVLVDVERGRTVRNWKPRRLGGGLGNTRAPKLPKRELGVAGPMRGVPVAGDRGVGEPYVPDQNGPSSHGAARPYPSNVSPAPGKLQWSTERRDDNSRRYGGRDDRRDDRRDDGDRDRGRDRGRDDSLRRDNHSRERRDSDRERDRDRGRERGDRDR